MQGFELEENDHQRKGTVWSVAAHVVSAVIGSGALSMAWSISQLGWILGPSLLLAFAFVTYYTSTLLADCYRSPHPISGKRNNTYIDAVRSYLGPRQIFLCGVAQYVSLWGAMVGYTITATNSMMAVKQLNCFHSNGSKANCASSESLFMVTFGVIEIVLSQFPSLENITWLSMLAATMSVIYSCIALCLCLVKWASHGGIRGSLVGVMAAHNGFSTTSKSWNALQALGNVAFAYTCAEVLIEIQDTLKSPPPENESMKKAMMYGTGFITIFYLSLGCMGYAVFGSETPGNILAGFGFYEPFWLIDIANLCVVIQFLGTYQVYAQPIFASAEKAIAWKFPNAKLINTVCSIRLPFTTRAFSRFKPSKFILRSVLIICTTVVAMSIPFFNSVMGLLGSISFWPLAVYFPVAMYTAQAKIERGTPKWVLLHTLSYACLMVSIAASIGSVADLIGSLKDAKPFQSQQ